MKAFLPLLLVVAALSGCAETPAETPETTTPAGTAALPEPAPPVNISFDGRTPFTLCVVLPVPGPCVDGQDPDRMPPFDRTPVNGTSFRIAGNMTWTAASSTATTLDLQLSIEDIETREHVASYHVEGESPLAFDWLVTDLPEGVQFELTAYDQTWLEGPGPNIFLPQDYHIEALLYDDAA